MVDHFNGLTPAEAERLALLLEEMGEAQQAIGKILRHGYASKNPHDPNGVTNRESLERELGDVRVAIDLLIDGGDIDGDEISLRYYKKQKTVRPYLHHQEPKP